MNRWVPSPGASGLAAGNGRSGSRPARSICSGQSEWEQLGGELASTDPCLERPGGAGTEPERTLLHKLERDYKEA